MDSKEKEFQDVLKHVKDVNARLAADPKFEGKKPEPVIPATLFVDQDDEFGGNDNNRRVAEAAAKQKKVAKPVVEASDEEVNRHLMQAHVQSVNERVEGVTAPVVEASDNPNNRRAAELETMKKEIVAGTKKPADLKKLLTTHKAEIEQQLKDAQPKSNEAYETFTPAGTSVWRPNS